MDFLIVAFYAFFRLKNVSTLVEKWKAFLGPLDIKGRIYLSEQGINAQLSIRTEKMPILEVWLDEQKEVDEMYIKKQPLGEHAFDKLIVKKRDQLVAIDEPFDLSRKGKYMTPKEWRKTIQSDADYVLIDIRNTYEYKIGHFKGAIDPKLETFREFPSYLETLKKSVSKDQKVLMCCTGGIRCEIFSSMMLREGFLDVNQLEGGIIAYGNAFGNEEFEGKLFVFDDRMAISLDAGKEGKTISHCDFCEEFSDVYYNCANMDCNRLFLACSDCYTAQKGCCDEKCTKASRLRKVSSTENKPFRKWYHYFQEQKASILSR